MLERFETNAFVASATGRDRFIHSQMWPGVLSQKSLIKCDFPGVLEEDQFCTKSSGYSCSSPCFKLPFYLMLYLSLQPLSFHGIFQIGQISRERNASLTASRSALRSKGSSLGPSVVTLTSPNTGLDFVLDLDTLNGLGEVYPNPTQLQHTYYRNV